MNAMKKPRSHDEISPGEPKPISPGEPKPSPHLTSSHPQRALGFVEVRDLAVADQPRQLAVPNSVFPASALQFRLHQGHVLCSSHLMGVHLAPPKTVTAPVPLLRVAGDRLQLVLRVGKVQLCVARDLKAVGKFVLFAAAPPHTHLCVLRPGDEIDLNNQKIAALFGEHHVPLPADDLKSVSRSSHCKINALSADVLQVANFSQRAPVRVTLCKDTGLLIERGTLCHVRPHQAGKTDTAWYEVAFYVAKEALRGDGSALVTDTANPLEGANADVEVAQQMANLGVMHHSRDGSQLWPIFRAHPHSRARSMNGAVAATFDVVVVLGAQLVNTSKAKVIIEAAPHTEQRVVAAGVAYLRGMTSKFIVSGGYNFGVRYWADKEGVNPSGQRSFDAD